MSINITVNGACRKPCAKYINLKDAEQLKKERTEELRIQRLQEVRNQSKDLARKLRCDVAAEKERQLRRLERIKAQELECWRQHVLAQRNHDYCNAIFQVGAAHCAARLENEQRNLKEKQCEKPDKQSCNSYLEFRKKLRARRQCNNMQEKNQPTTTKIVSKSRSLRNSCTHTLKKSPKSAEDSLSKRKRCNYLDKHTQCDCCDCETEHSTIEDEKDCPNACITLSTSCACSSSDEDYEVTTPKDVQIKKKSDKEQLLSKTPAVVLEVDENSDNSMYISPTEIKDNHLETNQQFTRMVEDDSPEGRKPESPKKSPKKAPRKASPRKSVLKEKLVQKTPVKDRKDSANATGKRVNLKKTPVTKTNIRKSTDSNVVPRSSKDEGRSKRLSTKSTLESGSLSKKRMSNITDLLRRQKDTQSQEKRCLTPRCPCPSASPTASKVKSPPKKTIPVEEVAPKPIVVTDQPPNVEKVSIVTAAPSQSTTRTTANERVQYYDYNNKFAKAYAQPTQSVETHQRRNSQPNAMQQAVQERDVQEVREKELVEQRIRTEERGESALLREQVRRDCIALTEKLEALTQSCLQKAVPNDANLVHSNRYATMNARKEAQMNAAVEEILTRPAIITCPEVDEPQAASPKSTRAQQSAPNEINLATAANLTPPQAGSDHTDSCCSLLLGYVDDQSKQIRNEIKRFEGVEDAERINKLMTLLERIEQIREILCKELNKNNVHATNDDQMKQVIDSISNVRKERENIVTDHLENHRNNQRVVNPPAKNTVVPKSRQTQRVETVSAKTKKITSQKNSKEIRVTSTRADAKPIEIVIKLQTTTEHGEQQVEIGKDKPIEINVMPKSIPQQSAIQGGNAPSQRVQRDPVNRQNSYDSNSTSYQSLPPKLSNDLDVAVERLTGLKRGGGPIEETPTTSRPRQKGGNRNVEDLQRTQRINPSMAKYVQRLLGMTRDSVQTLEVSTSDVDTPPNSVICAPTNYTSDSVGGNVHTTERLARVERFLEENRSFIGQLEETMLTHRDSSLEANMESFHKLWKQCLQNQGPPLECKERAPENVPSRPTTLPKVNVVTTTSQKGNVRSQTTNAIPAKAKQSIVSKRKLPEPVKPVAKPKPMATRTTVLTKQVATKKSTVTTKQPHVEKPKPVQQPTRTDVASKPSQPVEVIVEDPEEEDSLTPTPVRKVTMTVKQQQKTHTAQMVKEQMPDQKIARYEQLTENCTQRIAELTDLIQRVRVEKRRLVEVTLSSISDNGRNSTEYMELPGAHNAEGLSDNTDDQNSSASSRLLDSHLESGNPLPENAPLEKDKYTGRSHDSGISMSRPPTSQDQHQDIDPPSNASSTQAQAQRKQKPPPTILRFSPQLIDEENAHELSTILEVETPGTSRILMNSSQPTSARTLVADGEGQGRNAAVTFPTFEEYVQQFNVDLSLLNADQTMRIEQEFNELINSIKAAQNENVLDYDHFPTLATYLQTISGNESGNNLTNGNSPETINDLLACLRLANLTIQSFPTRKEYMKKLTNSSDDDLIDTESLERLSTDDTDTINIEEELRRRNIMKTSFRNEGAGTSSPPNSGMVSQFLAPGGRLESLFTSTSSSNLEQELREIGLNWPAVMQKKKRETDALTDSTSTTTISFETNKCTTSTRMREQTRHNNSDIDQPLSLREFLTKELRKHASPSSSSSSDSLRRDFFNSIIGNLTPKSSPHKSHSRSRKRTSTPVQTISTTLTSNSDSYPLSNTTTQLFSGESHLSSVHVQSPPIDYREQRYEEYYKQQNDDKSRRN